MLKILKDQNCQMFCLLEIILASTEYNPMNAIWNISIGGTIIPPITNPSPLGAEPLGNSPPVALPRGNSLGGGTWFEDSPPSKFSGIRCSLLAYHKTKNTIVPVIPIICQTLPHRFMTGTAQKICSIPPTRKSIPCPKSCDKDPGAICRCNIPAATVVAAVTKENIKIFLSFHKV